MFAGDCMAKVVMAAFVLFLASRALNCILSSVNRSQLARSLLYGHASRKQKTTKSCNSQNKNNNTEFATTAIVTILYVYPRNETK